jgi:tRNA threonylcarbamoyladenosine biosynthesis protein TsaB
MYILALDSTAVTASVCICKDEEMLCLYTVNNGNTHSETLLPMIESALKQTSLTSDDIDLYVCSAGPGSFTGVRIGSATLKGMAFGRGKPCVGVSTLEALARNLSILPVKALVCPVMNARRGQVYNALFLAENGSITRLTEDRLLTVSDLEAEISEKYSDLPVYLVGDGYEITKELFKSCSPAVTPEYMIYQNAYSVAMCGKDAYESGAQVSDAALCPTYLRPSQAERTREEKLARERDGAN